MFPTVVFNQDGGQSSRALLDSFHATGYFSFDYSVYSQPEVNTLIAGGKAKVGIMIPPDYSTNLASGQTRECPGAGGRFRSNCREFVLSAAQLAGHAHGTNIRPTTVA